MVISPYPGGLSYRYSTSPGSNTYREEANIQITEKLDSNYIFLSLSLSSVSNRSVSFSPNSISLCLSIWQPFSFFLTVLSSLSLSPMILSLSLSLTDIFQVCLIFLASTIHVHVHINDNYYIVYKILTISLSILQEHLYTRNINLFVSVYLYSPLSLLLLMFKFILYMHSS